MIKAIRWRSQWLRVGLLMAVALFCTIVAIAPTHPAYSRSVPVQVAQAPSDSVESLRQQQQRIEQERSKIQQERDRLQNLQQSAQERLGGLQNQIKVTTVQIEANEKRLQEANQRLQTLQADVAKALQSYQERQFSTVARLRFLQRQQGSRGWAVLLQSQNLNEFLDRRRQLRLVYGADQQILAELKVESEHLNRQRSQVEQQKNEIALLTQQLLAQKSQYEEQSIVQQALISRLREDNKALEAAEGQLERDSQNLATLIRERLEAASRDPSRVVVRGSGRFSYPISAALTSDFGWRVHPILGYRRFHAGIDFGAAHGSTIRSADHGRVIFSGWYGGYGQAVVIDHGGSITTLYAHASELYVSEGESVQRGQPIAAVGSTGFSTGPHLHFEVRENGEPVNPLGYL